MNLSGSPIDFIYAFLGGLAVSLTPCVFPLIPVTAGYIGIEAAGSRIKGFVFGFVYVSGVAVTYAALGMFSHTRRRMSSADNCGKRVCR
jgi:thiol:disulfide interchange protein DsbD